ncbi:hypothetical protein BDN67DRAFT_1073011, partial [Paxillus ammoniavirescens]
MFPISEGRGNISTQRENISEVDRNGGSNVRTSEPSEWINSLRLNTDILAQNWAYALKTCVFLLNFILQQPYNIASEITSKHGGYSRAECTPSSPADSLGASKPKSTKKSTKGTIDPQDAESGIDSAGESDDDSGEDTSLESLDPAQAACEIARLSRLSDDLGSGIEEAAAVALDPTPSTVLPVHPLRLGPPDVVPAAITVVKSAIPDENHRASVALMLKSRLFHQSKATVRSERVVNLDPRFASVNRTISSADKESKMTVQEASHRVRIAQALDSEFIQAKKVREPRWQNAARAIAQLVMPRELPNLE